MNLAICSDDIERLLLSCFSILASALDETERRISMETKKGKKGGSMEDSLTLWIGEE